VAQVKTRRLFVKVLVILVLLFGLTMLVMGGFAAWLFDHSLRDQYVSKGVALADSLASASVRDEDASTLQARIDEAARTQGVAYIFRVDEKGEVIAHTFVPAIPDEVRRLGRKRDETIASPVQVKGVGEVLDVCAPVLVGEAGFVHVGMDRGLIRKATWSAIGQGAALMGLVFVASVVGAYALVRRIARPLNRLTAYAKRLATGDLLAAGTAQDGADLLAVSRQGDEVGQLAAAFRQMVGHLRSTFEAEKVSRARIDALLESIRAAIARLTSTSSQLLAGTQQQAAGAQEQAAAVAEAMTTVDEVTQTADLAARRAKSVGDAVQRTLQIGQAGRKAVEDSLAAMARVKEQVEATADDILMLADRAQAISEIIATVNDIAEQTNLLSLNAAIEASRAGEFGRAFAVVAAEVKALADQSKKATTQVRQILTEIQKATHTAVLSTEQVTKGVAGAMEVGNQSGETIKLLADTLTHAAEASAQIVASAGQQATGMVQINQAIRNIDEVARQNLVATQQAEKAALNLDALGSELTDLGAK
jgi:methyl-accepting chemotaxis protein